MTKTAEVVNQIVRVADCTPHPRNYNQHDPSQIADLRDSLHHFGQVRSIVVQAPARSNGHKSWLTVAGHGLIEAAKLEGIDKLRADVIPAAWRPARVLAYLAADNELARRGNPDEAQLAAIVAEVQQKEGDALARLAAGEQKALDNLLRIANAENGMADADPQIDRAEELNKKWKVRTGDLWRIGEHRLLCGDSTRREDVERAGITRRMPTFTDPPYGVDYDPRFLAEIAERHNKKLSSANRVINDDGSLDLSFLWSCDRRMVWGFPYIKSGDESGWVVWDKQPGVESRGIVTPIEMASTTMRTGFDMVRVMWGGFYRAAGEDRQPHPTQKPIGVYQPFIESWTKTDDDVADYFAGSGPVLVACQNLQRRCRAIEISPAYCAVILERMATAFPGIEIERLSEDGNGRKKQKAR